MIRNRYRGCTAFLVTDERPPDELEKLSRRGILVVGADSANIMPHIWYGDQIRWQNPNVISINGQPMLEMLKYMGIEDIFHVGHGDLDQAITHALRFMPDSDNVTGLYS